MPSRSRSQAALFSLVAASLAYLLIEAAGYAFFALHFRSLPYRFAMAQFYPPEHHYLTDHPYLPYLAKKGRVGNLVFNALGDRGDEPESPKRRVRVVCYGGSTTFDGGHSIERTWPGYLQELLGRDKYEVINAAQNGATTADTLVNFALIHADLRPDFVLAMEGINDLEASYYPGFKSDYSHRRRKIGEIPYPVLYRLPKALNHSALYVAFRWKLEGPRGDLHALFSRPGKAYDFKNGPFGLAAFKRNLAALSALAKLHGAKIVLGTPLYSKAKADAMFGAEFAEGWQRGLDAENAIQRALPAADPNISIADISARLRPTDDMMIDFCHLTEAGNLAVARMFHDAIKRVEK
ncbi:MAG: SGNH/GDSL hydrolase family protein [Elusimicrobia bacterium]|nr:SGNH/GDSL hydrolase family protein [Elusimicrobiota bacterium]